MSRIKASKISMVLMIILVFSKLTGFIRDMVMARGFGAGMETDAYFIAGSASTVLFAIFGYALNTVVIPVISDVREREGKPGELKYVNNMLHMVFLYTLAMAVLGYFAAPVMIRILASGFTGEKFELAVQLTRIGLPIMIFNGFLCIMKGYLHVNDQFIVPAFEGFLLSIPVILYITLFAETYGIIGLRVTVVGTWFLRVLLYLPAVYKKEYRYRRILDFNDKNFKKTLILIGPIMIGVLSNYLNLVVDRTLASRLIESSVSALSYADRVKGVVSEPIMLTFTAVVYTMISRYVSSRDDDELRKTVNFGINSVLLVTIPAATGLIILNHPITKLLFQRGSFSASDTMLTSSALAFYSAGITGIVIADLLRKVFVAKQDTKTPMLIGVSAVALNIVLDFALVGPMGHRGLALATTIAVCVSACLYVALLRNQVSGLKLRQNGVVLIKSLISAAVMGVVVFVLKESVLDLVSGSLVSRGLNMLLIILAGVAVYFGTILLLRVEEAMMGVKWLMAKIRR